MTDEQRETLDDSLGLRVNSEAFQKFKERCSLINRPYQDVIREFMDAYVDGRASIRLTEAQQQAMKETYRVD